MQEAEMLKLKSKSRQTKRKGL